MNKVISFSLWGDNPKYTIGAIRNAEIAKTIYPDWVCRFYVGKSVPEDITNRLISLDNTDVISMDENGDWTGMFWRFLACEDTDIMISRDTDSRLSLREKYAVDAWLESSKAFHIMRDHPHHNALILGGMWGCRGKLLSNIRNLVDNYKKGDFWQVDQNFLRDMVYPIIKEDVIIHDELIKYEKTCLPYPTHRQDREFVGDVFDERDNRHPEYFKIVPL